MQRFIHYAVRACVSAAVCAVLAIPLASAHAAEVNGVKLPDTVNLANQELKLNGAGVRTKVIFKVYVAGLYLSGKKATAADAIDAPGAKRMTLVLLRDVTAEEFGQSFISGITKNSDRNERARIVGQLQKFGELFASIPEVLKGDVLTIDWIPGSGTHIALNGKKIAEPIPDVTFYKVFLKIWLGENPADARLKKLLLGEVEETPRPTY
ncbi:MAG: hypothetical protein JWQ23_759 [Herminiimonas sp.]|nr:hypothetical protein [Herminiimonas sp.]